ncbi:MAG: DNA polymerase III subunit epsilon [Microbacterium sp.]|nr:MAG: DNA polymerase III subunit epsilon [Microbacterium sp.]
MDQGQPLPLWGDERDDAAPERTEAAVEGAVGAAAPARWTDAVGVFDLETTGVDVTTDRIVTAHVGLLGPDGSPRQSRSWLADPGVEIPEGATAVHGITTAHARAHGRPAIQVVAEVVDALRELFAAGIPVVAYNASYDFSLLKHEALRHGIPPIVDPAPVIDPLVLDKAHDRFRKGKRTLEVVAAHYAVSLVGAHDAAADAIAAGRVAQALARRFDLTTPAHELHTQQIAWARAQAESLTEYFIRIGRLNPADRLDGSWPVR